MNSHVCADFLFPAEGRVGKDQNLEKLQRCVGYDCLSGKEGNYTNTAMQQCLLLFQRKELGRDRSGAGKYGRRQEARLKMEKLTAEIPS